ncbi:carbohydrate ABC transporter permease, partial [Achromobacter xylosoxidans]
MRNDAARVAGEGWRPWLVGAGVALVAFWCLFPLYWTLKASFMDESAIIMGVAHHAGGYTFENYLRVLGLSSSDSIFGGQTRAIMAGFVNSALVALPAAAAGTAIATLAGYVLGRFEF